MVCYRIFEVGWLLPPLALLAPTFDRRCFCLQIDSKIILEAFSLPVFDFHAIFHVLWVIILSFTRVLIPHGLFTNWVDYLVPNTFETVEGARFEVNSHWNSTL